VRVEPDGSVILARGPREPAGNLLVDDWESIRNHEVYRRYRQRIEGDTRCAGCPGLALCGADCPRNPAGWAKKEGIGD
jgi:radical SAM protein with 4Fe4S-binding SPASM domain